jgi:hypothetical protein
MLLLLPWACEASRLAGAPARGAVFACNSHSSAVAGKVGCGYERAGVQGWVGAGEKRPGWRVAENVSRREGALSNQGAHGVGGPSPQRGVRRSAGGIPWECNGAAETGDKQSTRVRGGHRRRSGAALSKSLARRGTLAGGRLAEVHCGCTGKYMVLCRWADGAQTVGRRWADGVQMACSTPGLHGAPGATAAAGRSPDCRRGCGPPSDAGRPQQLDASWTSPCSPHGPREDGPRRRPRLLARPCAWACSFFFFFSFPKASPVRVPSAASQRAVAAPWRCST